MSITPEAVDAVLALVRARDIEDGIDRGFDDYADIARLIHEELEVAAPFIRAEALRDAAEDFGTPNDVEIFPVEFDWPADARRTREHLRRRADELDPPRPLPTVRRPV